MDTILASVDITGNALGVARREKWDGREYLVAPVTMIVPGTLTGNNGAVYYPPEENVASAPDWNGMPIVVGHPQVNGEYVSARTPQVSKTSKVGRIYESAAPNGVLQAEAWIDIKAANRVNKQIVKDLDAGKALEVSTGLFLQAEKKKGKDAKGRPYEMVARNYKPDHLAILLDETGACSVADGCGLNVNEEPTSDQAVLADRERFYADWALAVRHLALNYDKSINDRMRSLGTQVDKRFTTKKTDSSGYSYNSYPYVADVYDDYVVFQSNGKYYKLGYTEKDGLCVLDSGDPVEVERYTVYEPVANTSHDQPTRKLELHYWLEEATDHVQANESGSLTPVANIVRKLPNGKFRLYSKTGKNLGTFDSKEAAEKHEREVEYFKHNTSTTQQSQKLMKESVDLLSKITNGDGTSGSLASSSQETAMDRTQMITWLTSNCACWKGKEKVLANKEAFSDDDIKGLKDTAELNARNAQTVNLVANAAGVKPEALDANALKDRIKPLETTAQAPVAPTSPSQSLGRAKDLREFESMIPPDAQGIWNSAKMVWRQQKDRLIANLAFGLEGQDRTDMINWLEGKEVPELEMMVKMKGPQVNQQPGPRNFGTDYGGAAGGPVQINRHMTQEEQADVLLLPGMPGYLDQPAPTRKQA